MLVLYKVCGNVKLELILAQEIQCTVVTDVHIKAEKWHAW